MTDFRCTGTVTNTNGSMTCSTGWIEIVSVNPSQSKTVFTDDLKIVSDVFSLSLIFLFCVFGFYLISRR